MKTLRIIPLIIQQPRFSYDGNGNMTSDGSPCYYVTDWQGNNAAVVGSDGFDIQKTTYYPYGEPTVEPKGQRYLFGGKEREHAGGRNSYDFGARNLTPYGVWSRPDPMATKFYNLNTYSYCVGDPINNIDKEGKDIVILNKGYSQHLAMLIQNEDKQWLYYSINGDNMKIPFIDYQSSGRPFNDVGVGGWNTPQEFLNSSYNISKAGESDKTVNNFEYSEGYHINTSPRQDATMRDEFSKIADTKYEVLSNNCATAVQRVMEKANVPHGNVISIKKFSDDDLINALIDNINWLQNVQNINIKPSYAFKAIVEANPSGDIVFRRRNNNNRQYGKVL